MVAIDYKRNNYLVEISLYLFIIFLNVAIFYGLFTKCTGISYQPSASANIFYILHSKLTILYTTIADIVSRKKLQLLTKIGIVQLLLGTSSVSLVSGRTMCDSILSRQCAKI